MHKAALLHFKPTTPLRIYLYSILFIYEYPKGHIWLSDHEFDTTGPVEVFILLLEMFSCLFFQCWKLSCLLYPRMSFFIFISSIFRLSFILWAFSSGARGSHYIFITFQVILPERLIYGRLLTRTPALSVGCKKKSATIHLTPLFLLLVFISLLFFHSSFSLASRIL